MIYLPQILYKTTHKFKKKSLDWLSIRFYKYYIIDNLFNVLHNFNKIDINESYFLFSSF